MPNSENYTLSINKYSEDDATTENHSYTASNAEDLKKILQLAGVLPYDVNAAEETPCGCGGISNEVDPQQGPQEPVEIAVPDYKDTPYDYEDSFSPEYSMPDWQARSYEKFTKTPAEQWPQVFEELTEELMTKGLTREEANEKVLEVMSLDLTENWDYGHRDMDAERGVHQYKTNTLDKSDYLRFKQRYVQAKYGDNPLAMETTEIAEKAKTVVDLYNDYLSEATNSYSTPINSKGERLSLNKKKDEAGDFIVRMYKNGKLYEPGCYYTDDWDDAVSTFHSMKNRLDESGMKRYAESLVDEYIDLAREVGFTVDPEEVEEVRKTGKGYVVMGYDSENEAYYVTRFEENEYGWDYPGNPEIETKSYDEAFTHLENIASNVIPPSAHGDAKGTIHLKKTQESDDEGVSSWGGAQVGGTVKPLKNGVWWAKNQSGTMKTFSDEKEARSFANGKDASDLDETAKPKKVVLGKFVKNPELEITAIPVRDKVTGKSDYKVAIIDKFDNNNKQIVLLRGAGTDFGKMVERIKSTNDDKFNRAGGVSWNTFENLSEDDPCWKGYKQIGMKKKGGKEVPNCIPEGSDYEVTLEDAEEIYGTLSEELTEAEYRGRKVPLNKPMRGDVKKFKVYVKDPKTGNVKKVNFGDPDMRIKKSNPERRKSFRARHNCDNPGPKTKARYWSCKKW